MDRTHTSNKGSESRRRTYLPSSGPYSSKWADYLRQSAQADTDSSDVLQDESAPISKYAPAQQRPPHRLPLVLVILVCLILVICAVVFVQACAGGSTDVVESVEDEQSTNEAQELQDGEDSGDNLSTTVSSTNREGAAEGAATGEVGLPEGATLTVALDPGHGGADSGAERGYLIEDALNWTIAQYCAAKLESYGVTVVFTRSQYEDLSLQNRALVAAEAGADVLVSLHINLDEDFEFMKGVTIYYPNFESTYLRDEVALPGYAIAQCVFSRLCDLGLDGTYGGLRELTIAANPNIPDQARYAYEGDTSGVADYYGIIRYARMEGIPAILVEHAYISNDEDYALLQDEAFLQAMGEADALGILEAFGYDV